jgi:hypothetical protein
MVDYSEFRGWGLLLRVEGLWFMGQSLGFMVYCLEFRV